MTTTPTRAKRNSRLLSADAIVKKVRAIYATQERRIAALKSEDELAASKLLGRALNEDEHAAARAMLSAVGIIITVIDAEYDDIEEGSSPDAAEAPDEDSDAGVEYGTMPPQIAAEFPEKVDELPRGATEYRPGPVAQAARGRR